MYIVKHKYAHLFYDQLNKVYRLYNDCDYIPLFKTILEYNQHVIENNIQNSQPFCVIRVITPGKRPFEHLDLYMFWAPSENQTTVLKSLKINLGSKSVFRTVHNSRLLIHF